MKKIGITGNIASGKSTVEKIISDNGYKVIDADQICHFALRNDEKIKAEVLNIFGTIDRKKLAEIVFNTPNDKEKLENILHPYVIDKVKEFFENNKNEKIVFVSATLLFEAGMQNMFDKIIFVSTDRNIRLKRLIKRNNYSNKEALNRINAQQEDDKINLADFLINNNSDLSELIGNTNEVLKKIISF